MKSLLVFFLLNLILTESCSPGPRYGYRQPNRRLTPLVRGQFIPDVSEATIGASGPALKPVAQNSAEFSKLVLNFNPDVIFLDVERDVNNRRMTQRCKDAVDMLAVLVADRWPTTRLRITKAWEPKRSYPADSLHYEGRAVDLTTSDRDTTKYGLLARLAVEAGFDWVHYRSKTFIHASVRPDDTESVKYGGCFPGDSLVTTEDGRTIPLEKVHRGDHVLAVDRQTGRLSYSEVIMLMDRQVNVSALFLEISTANATLTLTKNHLLFVADLDRKMSSSTLTKNYSWSSLSKKLFAEDLKIGQSLFVKPSLDSWMHRHYPAPTPILNIRRVVRNGVIAPLTRHGTIVIDNAVASCYSAFKSETIAHASFAFARTFDYFFESKNDPVDIHWYAHFLSRVANYIFPKSFFRFA